MRFKVFMVLNLFSPRRQVRQGVALGISIIDSLDGVFTGPYHRGGKASMRKKLLVALIALICFSGCGPIESGVVDTGILNTGGTDDPRRLIRVAHDRMYHSHRIVGARNVLRRAIERSKAEGDPYALAVSYNMMGYTYIQLEKDPKAACQYYEKAHKIINEHRFDCELVHNYIGFALAHELWGEIENACVYKENAQNAIKMVKYNQQHQLRAYEGGNKAIHSADERVRSLIEHFNCK